MDETKPLTPTDREDLIAYLDNEADLQATARVQSLLEKNAAARQEKDLLEESWRMLDVLGRPAASPNFRERTTSLASTNAYTDDLKTKRWGFHIWLGAVAAGLLGGWFGMWLMPDRHRETLKLLPVLERFDGLRAAGTIDFLREVHQDKLLPVTTKSGGSS
jgi:hypothetical protein